MGTGWSITGSWQGHYAYDPTSENPHPVPAVPFRLQLKQGWFGRFSGRVQDDPGRGTPQEGTIKGVVSGDQIEFVKWQPVCYMRDGDRLQSLREYLESQCNLPPDRDVQLPPINYRGRYDAATGRVAGTWEMRAGVIRFTVSFR
jgi:hypothetical protein